MKLRTRLLCFGVGAFALVGLLSGCERFLKKVPADTIKEVPYPTCDGKPLPEGELLRVGHLRSGPNMRDPNIVEKYRVEKRGCVYAISWRQEWPGTTSDVEVLYDETLKPLRAWKRMTVQDNKSGKLLERIERYELRVTPPTVKTRTRTGGIELATLRGGTPTAVIGPGRSVLSMWIRKAKLQPGEKTRETVLDFRRALTRLDEVTLRRDPDSDVRGLGPSRQYTVFGRETVFTDDQGWVTGDMRGLRPDGMLKHPPPAPIPMASPPDPVNTP